MLSAMHFVGMIFAVLLVIAVGIYSGRCVKNNSDFDSGGNKAGSLTVAGAIIGTLVGGSSTIGTAQLAYNYGLSAWWFTLGSGFSCLLLALFYVVPYRRSNCTTVMGMIRQEYGAKISMIASILSSLGIFIAILAQLIAATAILEIVLPQLGTTGAIALTALIMVFYVIFGGVLGAGMEGVVKLVLLYVSVITGGIIALHLSGGLATLYATLDHATYFNLFARGVGTDAGAGLSLIVGVLCTQSYAQSLRSGRTDRAAKCGALISACMIPPIGIGGILIGLYMRVHAPNLSSAKMAFPQFVLEHMPPLLAGIVLATLLITLVGAGAGLSLGISTVVRNDIMMPLQKKKSGWAPNSLLASRLTIVGILFAACIVCICPIGDTILNFSFMSMGFRGAVIFVPLWCAMWMPGKIDSNWVMASLLISPAVVFVFGVLDCLPFDPLFLGITCAIIFCGIGYCSERRRRIHDLTCRKTHAENQ